MPAWTFIRHGQSLANAEGWFAGQRDAPLTPLGRQQAGSAAAELATIDFDRALCSDLSRAHDTALRVLEGRTIPLEVTPILRERSCGSWEGRQIAALEAEGVMPEFAGWTTKPGSGESLKDVARRVCRLFAELPSCDSTLVVSHGALMRAVLGCVDARPVHTIGQWRPTNCEIIHRDVTAARWRELSDGLS